MATKYHDNSYNQNPIVKSIENKIEEVTKQKLSLIIMINHNNYIKSYI